MNKPQRVKGIRDANSFTDKTQVLQEARQCFMATSVKSKKLVDILTKCIILSFQGNNRLAKDEATELFFHITRLFQYRHKDSTLRRLTYIAIKALSEQADNIYVVTSSLTNDFNSITDPAIRASALRALCRISESSAFSTIEHYVKQGIMDKHPVVVSAALTSLMHIGSNNVDAVRRCTGEIQTVLHSISPMVQYHALGLLYNSCKNEPQAVALLIGNSIQLGLKSTFAICLLIRIISEYIGSGRDGEETMPYREFIKNNLSHHNDMVEYEAATALVDLNYPTDKSKDRETAVAHLRKFLTSDKLALRFASVRALNELASTSSQSMRFWSVHRIGGVCKLHLLNKRYRIGDQIVGLLDFTNATVICAEYTVILQCEETQQYELKQEFSLGLKRSDITITIPNLVNTKQSVLHCVLSFLFSIADENYSKTLFEDRAGTIELGPSELGTKLFSCDFPIAIHT